MRGHEMWRHEGFASMGLNPIGFLLARM